MSSAHRKEAVAEVHFTGSTVEDTRGENWTRHMRFRGPGKHHGVSIDNFFGDAPTETESIRKMHLTRQSICARCIRDIIVREDKDRLFFGTVHFETMVRQSKMGNTTQL